jgi:hypothetical protein
MPYLQLAARLTVAINSAQSARHTGSGPLTSIEREQFAISTKPDVTL